MKRRILKLAQLAALAAAVFCSSDLRARPPEVAVGGPEGAPNLTANPTLKLIAQWDLTKTRYYRLDYDGGQNSPGCYIDATAGATLSGPRACKTFDYVISIIPHYGNGRSAVLLVKPRAAGATYRNTANTADADFNFSGISGYRYFLRRGSNDLTNSTADRVTAGGITAVAGPNGDGSFTVAGGGTVTTFSVSAGSFGATDAVVGYRWRFSATTTTVALRNIACFVNASTGTAVTCGSDLGTAPSAGDTGFIESPGVRVGTFTDVDACANQPPSSASACPTVGFSVTSSANGAFMLGLNGVAQFSFIETTASTSNVVLAEVIAENLTISQTYADETSATRTTGAGVRSASAANLIVVGKPRYLVIGFSAFLRAAGSYSFALAAGQIGSGGTYFANGPLVSAIGDSGFRALVGTTSSTSRRMRVVAGTLTISGHTDVRAVDITNATTAAITLGGPNSATSVTERAGVFGIDDVVGSTGNTGVGIDGSSALGATVLLGRLVTNTVTGTSGDLKLGGGAIGTHADLVLTNVVDSQGNNWIGSGGVQTGPARLVTNQSGGALAVGSVVRSNGSSNQVACAQADTVAHTGNAPCVMVTAPASTALGYMVCTGAPYVLYDGAPSLAGPSGAYVSVGTACKATTTIPPVAATNQKLRVGFPFITSGNAAYTNWQPESTCVVADGAK